MILKLGLSINGTNIVPYPAIVLSNVLKVTFFSANLTYHFHFTYLQLGLTDPLGQQVNIRTIQKILIMVYVLFCFSRRRINGK
jgi:hypothetical protein